MPDNNSPLFDNLRFLAKLASITGSIASPFYMGFSDATHTLSLTPQGAIPIEIVEPSSQAPVINSKTTLLSSPLTNQSSPATILTVSYTPTKANSNITIKAGAQISNTTPGASSVDVGIFVNAVNLVSSRTYQNSDVGSTSFEAQFTQSTVNAITIVLKATLISGTTNLGIPAAFVNVIETV